MRRSIIALAALAGVIVSTGVAIAAPVLHLSGWKATAGTAETFTITRISGNGGTTVTFATGAPADVAKPGVDYTPVNQTITWQPRQTSAAVSVRTFPNAAYAGKNISFTVTIAANGKSSTATGLIMEPAAAPPPPPPATQTCPDGSVIPATSQCPVAPPPPPLVWSYCAVEDDTCRLLDVGPVQVRYGFGTTWTMKTVTGSIGCSNGAFGVDPLPGTSKICQTTGTSAIKVCPDGSIILTRSDCPPAQVPTGSWAAAPLKVGGYAWTSSNQPQGCCKGIVSRVIAGPITSSEVDPAMRQQMWLMQFYSDSTGNFPVGNVALTGFQSWWREKDIQGVAPAP